MKKIIFAMFVAIAATVGFTSCGGNEEKAIVLSDVAGYTFEGQNAAKTNTYSIAFGASAQTFEFSVTLGSGSTPLRYTGTYTISVNTLTLNYGGGVTETLTGDGAKKLLYSAEGTTITLTRK